MSMGIGKGINFENLISIDMDIGMTFQNGYGCGYNFTRSVPSSRPSLLGGILLVSVHRISPRALDLSWWCDCIQEQVQFILDSVSLQLSFLSGQSS